MSAPRSLIYEQLHTITSNDTAHGLGITLSRPNGPRPLQPFQIQEPRVTFATPSNTRITSSSITNVSIHSQRTMLAPVEPGFHPESATATPAVRDKIQLGISASTSLDRQPTLFMHHAPHERKVAELKNILGNESSGKLEWKAKVLSSHVGIMGARKRSKSAPPSPIVSLEQAKSKARVELDLLLDSGTCVEGGYIKGKILVKIRAPTRKEGPIYIGAGKVRVVGFEAIPFNDERFIFYHCGAPLDHVSPYHHVLYRSPPDNDGFHRGSEGDHVLPFAMRLPARQTNMPVAKGVYDSKSSGLSIRYIAMVSLKIRDTHINSNSIAHVYRSIEVWPLFDPITTLAPAPSSLYATTAQSIFLGGQGKLKLTASLHRATWVAGQRCYVKIFVANETEKRKVQTVSISLIRSETVFKPNKEVTVPSPSETRANGNSEAYHTSTTKRVVARSVLEMGEMISARHATAKGWWTGIEGGRSLEFSHYILIPPFALTIPRSRLIEVDFVLEIGISTGFLASDVSVQLPIRIINYISLDPPPSLGGPDKLRNLSPLANSSSIQTQPGSLDKAVQSAGVDPLPQANESFFQTVPHFVGNENGTYRGDTGMPTAGLGRLIALNRGISDSGFGVEDGGPGMEVDGISLGVEPLAKGDSQEIGGTVPALEESHDGFVETECLGGHHSLRRIPDALHIRMAPGHSGFGHWDSDAEIRVSPLVHSRRATVQSGFRDADEITRNVDPNQFDDGMEEIEHKAFKVPDLLQQTRIDGNEGISNFAAGPLLLSRPPSINESSTCSSRATSHSEDRLSSSSDTPSQVPSTQALSSHPTAPLPTRQSVGMTPKRNNFSTRPLPQPHRPRPHPVFTTKTRDSTRPLPIAVRLRASIEASDGKMETPGGTRADSGQDIIKTEWQKIDPPAVVEAFQQLTRPRAIVSTTMEDIPRTVSALLAKNLKTPNPITESAPASDLPYAPVFGRAFTSVGEAPRNQANPASAEQLSSIKTRIAMFEQKSDDIIPLPRKVMARASLLPGAGPARFSGGRL